MKGRISPAVLAGVLIVLADLGLGGLRSWGVINPAVSARLSGAGVLSSDETSSQLDPHVRLVHLELTNHSRSSLEVAEVRTMRPLPRNASMTASARLPKVVSVRVVSMWRANGGTDGFATPADTGASNGRGELVPDRLNLSLEPGMSVSLAVQVWLDSCTEEISPGMSALYSIVADLHTAWGRTKTVGRDSTLTTSDPSCVALPAPGTSPATGEAAQPVDPGAARRDVAAAFATVYDFSQPAASRLARIDDPLGVEAATSAVVAGSYGSSALNSSAKVVSVDFTSPSTARVAYQLTVGGTQMFGTRVGSARLVDGTWKVARGTVCADLELADGKCVAAG